MKRILIALCALSMSTALFAERKSFKEQNYFLKKGYISRTTYTHFDDTPFKDEYQDDVYYAAWEFASRNGFTKIGDLGCGSGYKLIKYFSDVDTIGLEIEPTLSFLKKTYPNRDWRSSEFHKKPPFDHRELIICADVIEHLVDPDDMMNWLSECNFDYVLISTPDRDSLDSVWGKDKKKIKQSRSGPPVLQVHVREWGFNELHKYVSQYFEIVEHFHPFIEKRGQVIIARKRR